MTTKECKHRHTKTNDKELLQGCVTENCENKICYLTYNNQNVLDAMGAGRPLSRDVAASLYMTTCPVAKLASKLALLS